MLVHMQRSNNFIQFYQVGVFEKNRLQKYKSELENKLDFLVSKKTYVITTN